ncbi:MAG: signal peptidase II [candidate division KSB1 bacterium]|nr:signal peptidase II [candidate division KSB1 bacterium]
MAARDLRLLGISALVVLADQVTKAAARAFLQGQNSIAVLGQYVRLTYLENPGMAFGIRVGGPAFFSVFASLASLVVLVYLLRLRGERMGVRLALALVFGGAIGNLIDRLLYGQVVDFIDVGVGDLRWPVFNVADSAVTVGMVLLMILMLFERPAEPSAAGDPPSRVD